VPRGNAGRQGIGHCPRGGCQVDRTAAQFPEPPSAVDDRQAHCRDRRRRRGWSSRRLRAARRTGCDHRRWHPRRRAGRHHGAQPPWGSARVARSRGDPRIGVLARQRGAAGTRHVWTVLAQHQLHRRARHHTVRCHRRLPVDAQQPGARYSV